MDVQGWGAGRPQDIFCVIWQSFFPLKIYPGFLKTFLGGIPGRVVASQRRSDFLLHQMLLHSSSV